MKKSNKELNINYETETINGENNYTIIINDEKVGSFNMDDDFEVNYVPSKDTRFTLKKLEKIVKNNFNLENERKTNYSEYGLISQIILSITGNCTEKLNVINLYTGKDSFIKKGILKKYAVYDVE